MASVASSFSVSQVLQGRSNFLEPSGLGEFELPCLLEFSCFFLQPSGLGRRELRNFLGNLMGFPYFSAQVVYCG